MSVSYIIRRIRHRFFHAFMHAEKRMFEHPWRGRLTGRLNDALDPAVVENGHRLVALQRLENFSGLVPQIDD
jgi:hypothetical protein